jgi:hypothetical protein
MKATFTEKAIKKLTVAEGRTPLTNDVKFDVIRRRVS